jgi:two-component sensor histidine kinase
MAEAVESLKKPVKHRGQFAPLLDMIEQLSMARSIEGIAEVVRQSARSLSGADGVTFVLRDGQLCHYLDEDAISPLWKGQRFPMQSCISGWCMTHNDTAIIPDIYVDARIPHDAYRPTFVKSLVMTPVRGDNNPPAAIGAYWREYRTPTKDEIDILAAIARSTAIAIENVNLLTSIEESARHAKLLYDELQHRVRNNLTTIISILQLQMRHSDDERLRQELGNTQRRVLAVAALHTRMMRDHLSGFDFAQYIEEVCHGVKSSLLKDRNVAVTVQVRDKSVGIARAMSYGLIVNELLTNAARYAFEGRAKGHIDVTVERDGADVVLTVKDDGVGLSDNRRNGLGLRLVETSVRTLEGAFAVENGSGVTCRVRAPAKTD